MSDLQDALNNAQSNDLYIPLPILKAARLVANPNRERMKLALHMLSVTKPDPDTAIDRLLAAALTPGTTDEH
jgi:hypothetical protein